MIYNWICGRHRPTAKPFIASWPIRTLGEYSNWKKKSYLKGEINFGLLNNIREVQVLTCVEEEAVPARIKQYWVPVTMSGQVAALVESTQLLWQMMRDAGKVSLVTVNQSIIPFSSISIVVFSAWTTLRADCGSCAKRAKTWATCCRPRSDRGTLTVSLVC